MATTYGICGVCRREKRLTDVDLVVEHVAKGKPCLGSGERTVRVTRMVYPPGQEPWVLMDNPAAAPGAYGQPRRKKTPAAQRASGVDLRKPESKGAASRAPVAQPQNQPVPVPAGEPVTPSRLGVAFPGMALAFLLFVVVAMIAFYYRFWVQGVLACLLVGASAVVLARSTTGRSLVDANRDRWRRWPTRPRTRGPSRAAVAIGALVVLVVAIGMLSFLGARSDRQDAEAALLESQMVACQTIRDDTLDHVSVSGAFPGGIAWAQRRLAVWPDTRVVGDCSHVLDFVQKLADGVATRTADGDIPADDRSCDERLADAANFEVTEQARRDNSDFIRMGCGRAPLQQSEFWQQTWERYRESPASG